jgi:aspartokinase/homoserine dehydrogenase 1
MIVHKFGGTSVANAERYRRVAEILAAEPDANKAIVVSAMSGVTDKLIELTELARKQDATYKAKLDALKQQHLKAAEELGAGASLASVFENDFSALGDLLKAVWLGKSCSEETLELVSGHGELWSAQLLNAYLDLQHGNKAANIPASRWLDARQVLVVTAGESGPVIDWEASKPRFKKWMAEQPAASWIVITGFIASRPDGVATTLKRNGSDFSASIFGVLAGASAIVIWSDVDGVLSADPRRVPEAVVLDEMSYNEAMELAYFGAKVIHPHTMTPALKAGIPIFARNTFNPSHPGTKIHKPDPKAPPRKHVSPVKGFSTVDKVALVNVEGTGMIGVPGVANRLFGALREARISVIMISQASSEHSICFAVPEAQGDDTKATVEKAFFAEIHHGQVQSVQLVQGCSILAAVGDGMVHASGVSAKFFGALGRAGISIRAIAQGSSERNISVVIDQKDATRALRAVHSGLYLSEQTLSVGIIGPGLIGGALLKQLEAQASALRSQFKIDLRIRGLLRSGKMLLANPRIELGTWQDRFEKEGVASDLDAFVNHIQADHLPHSVIIDCTSNEDIALKYRDWLGRGIHIVTPNKKANSGKLAYYRELRELGSKLNTFYFYEATVGAGLPVITTLRDLIQTGDRVHRIDGVLSGTLSYLFNSFDGKRPFSEIVSEAKQKGYTEPDPRDDLSGRDVARKLIILAREMGLSLELEQIEVESLVPAELASAATADEFMAGLPRFDSRMEKLWLDASQAGQCLRYVGLIDAGTPGTRSAPKCSVRLERYPLTHSFARISGSDNIIAFQTSRYSSQPLIVQGPGAGPEVTAGGIFGDLLRLSASLGTPL